jgi:hypothetical protein
MDGKVWTRARVGVFGSVLISGWAACPIESLHGWEGVKYVRVRVYGLWQVVQIVSMENMHGRIVVEKGED